MYINVTWNCRVCVEVAFLRLLSAVRMLAKPYHFRVNWPTTLCENNGGCISLPSNKLLLCNSGYDDIAWCNKNNSELGFCGFFLKNNKNLFLSKKRNKKNRWVALHATAYTKQLSANHTTLILVSMYLCALAQWFSTWGSRTPRGSWEDFLGYLDGSRFFM